jgi:hypothetical protein
MVMVIRVLALLGILENKGSQMIANNGQTRDLLHGHEPQEVDEAVAGVSWSPGSSFRYLNSVSASVDRLIGVRKVVNGQ